MSTAYFTECCLRNFITIVSSLGLHCILVEGSWTHVSSSLSLGFSLTLMSFFRRRVFPVQIFAMWESVGGLLLLLLTVAFFCFQNYLDFLFPGQYQGSVLMIFIWSGQIVRLNLCRSLPTKVFWLVTLYLFLPHILVMKLLLNCAVTEIAMRNEVKRKLKKQSKKITHYWFGRYKWMWEYNEMHVKNLS